MNRCKPGQIVAVWNLPVDGSKDGKRCTISGLYEVVEFWGREPSAYVWRDLFVLVPAGEKTMDNAVDVDADRLWEQVDPEGYGRMVVQEHEMEIASFEMANSEEAM